MASSTAIPAQTPRTRLVWLVFPLVALLVVAVWQVWMDRQRAASRAALERRAQELAMVFDSRVQQYASMVRAAAGFASGMPGLPAQAWGHYVASLGAGGAAPGILGLGYAPAQGNRVPFAHASAGARVRDTVPLPAQTARGTPASPQADFRQWRRAAERARDQADMAAQTWVEGERARGVLIMPVYRPAATTATVSDRRSALLGWVYLTLRWDGVFAAIAPVGDGAPAVTLIDRAGGPGFTLFASAPDDASAHAAGTLWASRAMSVGGQDWILRLSLPAGVGGSAGLPAGWAVLALGLCAALFATGCAVAVLGTRRRAVELARALTTELQGRTSELQVITDNSPLGIFRWSADLSGVWLNARCEQLIGMRESEVLAKGWEATAAQEDRERLRAQWNSALWQGAELDIEYRCQEAGDQARWLRVRSAPVKLDDGVVGVVGTVEDITAARSTALQASRSRAFLEAVVDSIPAVVFVKDASHRYVLLNEFGSRFLGHAREDVIGRTDRDVRGAERAREDWAQDDAVIQGGDSTQREEAFEAAGGVQRWVMKTRHRAVAEDGDVFVVGAIFDLTAQREAQIEVQRAREFLDQLLDTLPNPIFVKNAQREWLLVNRAFCEYARCSREQLIGHIDPIQDGQSERRALEDVSVLTSGTTLISEDCELMEGGAARWVIKSKSRIQLPDGGFGIAGALTDITLQKAAESNANSARQFLTQIVDSIPLPLFVKDVAHRFVITNVAFRELLAPGHAEAYFLGKTDADFLSAEEVHIAFSRDDEALAAQGPQRYEQLWTGADGEQRHLLKTKAKVVVGGQAFVVGVNIDITEARHAAVEAERARQFLNSVIDAMPQDVYVKDQEGRWLIVNQAMCDTFQVPRERLVGFTAADLLPPEKASVIQAQDREVLAGDGPLVFESEALPEGRARQWLLMTKSPVRLSDGSRYLVGVNTDVTALREALREVERAQQFFHLTIDAMQQGLMVKDEQGRFVTANKVWCELAGLTLERIQGKTVWDIYPEHEARELQKQDEAAYARGEPVVFEQRASSVSGRQGWILKTKSVLALQDGSRYLVSGTVDITTIKRTEQALLESQSRLRVLHEVAGAMARGATLDEIIGAAVEAIAQCYPDWRVSYARASENRFLEVTHSRAPAPMLELRGARWDTDELPGLRDGVLGSEVFSSDDIHRDARCVELRAQYAASQIHAVIYVPLVRGQHWEGLLSIGCPLPHVWADHEVRLLRETGEYLRIAMRQAIAETERSAAAEALRRSETRMRQVHAVSQGITANLALEETVRIALQGLHEEFAGVTLRYAGVRQDGHAVVTQSVAPDGGDGGAGDRIALDLSADTPRQTAQTGIHWVDRLDVLSVEVQEVELASSVRVPLRDQDHMAAVLVAESALPRHWTGHEIHTLRKVGDALQVAIRSARINRERERAQAELRGHRDNLQQLVAERTLEAVRAKEAAERANYAKSEFLANMSHELRTPMHAILSFAQLGVDRAARGAQALPKLQQYLERIRDSGQRLLKLLNDLLDLSKLEAGHMNYEFQRHALKDILSEVVAELTPLARQLEVTITCRYEEESLAAWCDAGRVGQVFRNLLSNALKFTPAGRSVQVSVARTLLPAGRRSEDNSVVPGIEIQVADEGLGIPEGELELIFDKFVQSSKTKSGAGGTGLGLAICREIVTQHGGSIHAAHHPGGGALFTFSLRQEPGNPSAIPVAADGLPASRSLDAAGQS